MPAQAWSSLAGLIRWHNVAANQIARYFTRFPIVRRYGPRFIHRGSVISRPAI